MVRGRGPRADEAVLVRKSTRELEAEIARYLEELRRLGALEDAAEKRHAAEGNKETEAVYGWRQEQVERTRKAYRRLIIELSRRNGEGWDGRASP